MAVKKPIMFDRREGQRRVAEGSAELSPHELAGEKVRVLDLSPSGIRARCQIVLSVGKVVSLAIPGVGMVPARVMWAAEGEFGARFLRPIDLDGCAWRVETGPRGGTERRGVPVRAPSTPPEPRTCGQASLFAAGRR